MIKIRVDGITGLQQELNDKVKPENISKAMLQGILLMEAEAKRLCPVDTQKLMQSIIHHKISDLTYEIKATAKYADYIEYGTRGHWIYPKNKKSLMWKKDGETYFSKGVYHPGIKVGTEENPIVYSSPHKAASYRPFLRTGVYNKFNDMIRLIEMQMEEK